MYRYNVWVRVNAYQTVNIVVNADSDYQARLIAEGQGFSVLNYSRIYD